MEVLDAVKTASVKKEKGLAHQLTTPWSEAAARGDTWKEYPRPQMVRKEWINLNGRWDYAILPAAKGENGKASDPLYEPKAEGPYAPDGEILVPFSPESALSGVGRILMPGELLWYHRTFLLPDLPAKSRLLLHFGAVDERCRVFVNGEEAGFHHGGYVPFTLEITRLVRPGENDLSLLCADDTDTSFHTRGKQKLERGGMFYTPQSGIWQTVWLEWVPEAYISDLRLTPRFDEGELTVQVIPQFPAGEEAPSRIQIRLSVTDGEETVAGLSAGSAEVSVKIPNFIPWTPENPHLYGLTLTMEVTQDGAETLRDEVRSYFAMRAFTVEKDEAGLARLCINHEPCFENGLLDQGYWPDGLYTAPCDEALIYDIRTMKEAGFNMLRKHCKIEPLRWYYHCDRLGMLVWQDVVNGGSSYNMTTLAYLPTVFPNYGAGKEHVKASGRTRPESHEEWFALCRDTISLLYNAPCLAAWTLFNEGWGQFDTQTATAFARQLDATRPFDQASGWFDHRGGDIKSVHNYFRKLTCPKVNTPSDLAPEAGGANKCGLRAAVLSEYGGLALPLEGHIATGQVYGYKNLKSPEEFKERFEKMQNEVQALAAEGLSAAIYTQVSDIEDEVNGILTYDRRVNKLAP